MKLLENSSLRQKSLVNAEKRPLRFNKSGISDEFYLNLENTLEEITIIPDHFSYFLVNFTGYSLYVIFAFLNKRVFWLKTL